MQIYLVKSQPSEQQTAEMLEAHGRFIKVAVDLAQRRLAGGGEMHADCEELLLESGSRQEDVWGGNWYPEDRQVEFESFINIRPRHNNRGMELRDLRLRLVFEDIVRKVFKGTAGIESDRVSDVRARYLRDSQPVRLGNLASSLARIASCARREGRDAATEAAIRECALFVEWGGGDADPTLQSQLAALQRDLVRWGKRWAAGERDDLTRADLTQFARSASQQALEWSGLLDEEPAAA